MKIGIPFLALALAGSSLGVAQSTLTGSLIEAGVERRILPHLVVSAQRVDVALTATQVPAYGEARADEKGQFSIRGLPAGIYKICVPNEGDLLDPCAWPAYYPANRVTVPGPDRQVALLRGYRVFVRFDGPADFLKPENGRSRPGVEAWLRDAKDNRIRVFDIWRRSESSLILSSVVPFDPSLKLFTSSAQFVLSDTAGRLLPSEGEARPVPPKQAVPDRSARSFPGGGRITGEPTVFVRIAGRKSGGGQ